MKIQIFYLRTDCTVIFNRNQTKLIQCLECKTGEYVVPKIEAICDFAFRYCRLSKIELVEGITTIGIYAFADSSLLTTVRLPDGLSIIAVYLFSYCVSLTEITIPSSVSTIRNNAFQNCLKLQNITIPSSVETILSSAFFSCTSLERVNIGSGLKTLDDTFGGCSCLIEFNVSQSNEYFTSFDGILFNKNQSTLVKFPTSRKGAYRIPDTVNMIYNGAFAKSKLTKITIDKSVTVISNSAFQGSSLKTAIIGENVNTIGYHSFEGCKNLTNIVYLGYNDPIEPTAFKSCAIKDQQLPVVVDHQRYQNESFCDLPIQRIVFFPTAMVIQYQWTIPFLLLWNFILYL